MGRCKGYNSKEQVFELELLDSGINDIKEAFDWYDNINTIVSSSFQDELFLNLEYIRDNPYSSKCSYKNKRAKPLKKFPYIIFYSIEEIKSIVLIHAIFHTSQNPKKII